MELREKYFHWWHGDRGDDLTVTPWSVWFDRTPTHPRFIAKVAVADLITERLDRWVKDGDSNKHVVEYAWHAGDASVMHDPEDGSTEVVMRVGAGCDGGVTLSSPNPKLMLGMLEPLRGCHYQGCGSSDWEWSQVADLALQLVKSIEDGECGPHALGLKDYEAARQQFADEESYDKRGGYA